MQNELKQNSIKFDLELSFLKTKVGLLEETLNNKSTELKSLDSYKDNNNHLMKLLEKYDVKLSQMQDDIDVRDLRINELIEKYNDSRKGNLSLPISSLELNLDIIEARVKFLINLLEKWREQLENEALAEDDKLEECKIRIAQINKENENKEEILQNDSGSISGVVQNYLLNNFHSYSESKEINNKLL